MNDQMIKGMAAKSELTEQLVGRGAGTIVLRRRTLESQPAAYLRYSYLGKRQLVSIGNYKATQNSLGLTLKEIREEARKLSDLLKNHPDLKAYLEQQRIEAEQAEVDRVRLAAIEAAKGTFRQLFSAYIADRESAGVRPDQVKDFRRILAVDLEAFPDVMGMLAKEVLPAHINKLLSPIVERGSVRQSAKVRSFLMAAFQYGLKRDNLIGSTDAVTFDLAFNPVMAVTFTDEHKKLINKAGKRALTEAEFKQFYLTIDSPESGVSYVMGQLFRLVIATGGQRIEQLCREPWSSYTDSTVCLIDAKGKGGQKREHYVPLSDRAKQIIKGVKDVTESHTHPFSELTDEPFTTGAFSRATRRWLKSKYAVIDGERIEHFTPRDVRRTLTQLMQKYGVSNSASDELQSHGVTGVVNSHYRNDPKASIPAKAKTIAAVERIISSVLGEDVKDNVVQLHKMT